MLLGDALNATVDDESLRKPFGQASYQRSMWPFMIASAVMVPAVMIAGWVHRLRVASRRSSIRDGRGDSLREIGFVETLEGSGAKLNEGL